MIEAMRLCARGRGSEPACRERNINSRVMFIDGPVRLADDNVDVFVRGKILSAGLMAERGASCHVRLSSLSQPCWSHRHAGRLLVSPEVGASLSAISRPYQI